VIRKNGASSGINCQITGSATACTDPTNSLAFAAGDRVSILATESGSPSGASATFTAQYTP
jgi:hypothetical protein